MTSKLITNAFIADFDEEEDDEFFEPVYDFDWSELTDEPDDGEEITHEGNDNRNVIRGSREEDIIVGHGGNDRIHGRQGDDEIYGGDGNDFLKGGLGDDYIAGGAGNDRIWGNNGNDIIWGGDGNDVIWGGNGDDVIHGGDGNDIIRGGNGNDLIRGGLGDDKLVGGRGNDTFVFEEGFGKDVIWDFRKGNNVIDLRLLEIESFDHLLELADITVVKRATIIDFGDGNSITLRNFRKDLDDSHFLFYDDAVLA